MNSYSAPLLNHNAVTSCLDSSRSSRSIRQNHWTEYLKTVCSEDEAKWRNKCASMLRRIQRLKNPASLSPSLRDNQLQSAIEDYSIETGLDYEQSKSVLVAGEWGGTPTEFESRMKAMLEDPAFKDDEILAEGRSLFHQFSVWLLSRSLWVVLFSCFVGFIVNASWLSAVPVITTCVVGLSSFPFPSHFLWKFLLAFSALVLAFKSLLQFTSSLPPDVPAQRLGLYEVSSPHILGWLSLLWTEIFTIVSILVHFRALHLSGRLSLNPGQARQQIGSDAQPSKDLYAVRFVLSLIITLFLITDWTTISASKIPNFSKSVLGEGISRNYFSAFQVVAVTLFVFHIVLDRCLYTLMSYEGGDVRVVKMVSVKSLIRIMTFVQFTLLMFAMNLRVVLPFFLVYSAYLVLTCYQLSFQIRSAGAKKWFSYYAYRIYLAVPFLDELRQLCDWVATPATSLSLFMWFKVEDCIQNLRIVQAEMDGRANLPLARADRGCIGFTAIIGVVTIITGPLIFFSGLNVLREPNPVISSVPGLNPTSLKISLELQTNTLRTNLYSSTQLEATCIDSESVKSDEILAPLLVMQSSDLQRIRFPAYSDSPFTISPALRKSLVSALRDAGDANVTVKAEWTLNREFSGFQTILNTQSFVPASSVLAAIEGKTASAFNVPNLIPAVVYLDSTPSAKIIPERGLHADTKLQLNRDAQNNAWWSLTDPNGGVMILGERSMGGSGAAYSISVVGLYLGVVLTVGRFLRLSILGSSKRINVEELPCTETVMHLCQGIHIARIFKDIDTEKRLYYDLVKLFRDPQLLIAATGPTTEPYSTRQI